MQGQILPSAAPQGIYGGIVPDIGAVAAVPAELDHIEMRCGSDPVHKDQFMLGSVQRSHSRIGLVPDAQVQELAIDRAADCRDVVHVSLERPPIDEVERFLPWRIPTSVPITEPRQSGAPIVAIGKITKSMACANRPSPITSLPIQREPPSARRKARSRTPATAIFIRDVEGGSRTAE